MRVVRERHSLSGGIARACSFSVVALVLAALVISSAPPAQASVALHGIAFLTGCESPVAPGQPMGCHFLITNVADADTLTITSFTEVVDGAAGPDLSGNLLPSADLTFAGGAQCSPGQLLCTLPPGGRIETASPVLFHTVTGDDVESSNPLTGTATLVWQDLCTSQSIGCPTGNQVVQGTLQSTLVKLSSGTDTNVHNAAHQIVTAVEAGSKVHDVVTVSGGPGAPTPTGTVTVDFFDNDQCTGTPLANSGSVLLVNGSVDVTAFSPTLRAGGYSFLAHYPGSSVYAASDGPCEPVSAVDAAISIAANGVDEVNHEQTFTVTVMKNPGDGSGFVPAAGVPISYSLTDTNGARHRVAANPPTTCDGTTDGDGQCRIVFTSRAAGKVRATASVSLGLGGVTISRDTDPATPIRSGPSGSGAATKTLVDAGIAVSPDATVAVGDDHTFTVTVKRNLASGAGFVNAPAGTKPAVTLAASGGATVQIVTNTCATTGTVGGRCRVTVTSPTAGKIVATAAVTVTVKGIGVTRDTDPSTATTAGPGGSGRARAFFVDTTVGGIGQILPT